MNKSQLSVAWVMAFALCSAVLFTPKMSAWKEGLLIIRKEQFLAPLVNWSLVCGYCFAILVVGGLLIYTLKGKK